MSPRVAPPSLARARVRASLAILVALAGVTLAAYAFARPGGGGSFSGGSSGGSHGGGGGGGGGGIFDALFSFLISLVFDFLWDHPVIGIPVLLGLLGVVAYSSISSSGKRDWSSGGPASEGAYVPPPSVGRERPATLANARRSLEQLRVTDANFSLVLLEDFLYALYAEVHTARGAGQAARLSAYLAPEALAAFAGAPATGVRDIVVGAMRFTDFRMPRGAGPGAAPPEVRLTVEFESNYTEGPPTAAQSYYVRERWTLARRVGVQSRTPEKARVFGCPGCGAPQDAVFAGQCRYCQRTVSTGEFDWVVRACGVVERETRGPMLTGDTVEQGNELRTVIDPAAMATLAQLGARDPAFTWAGLSARIGLVFNEFQTAWSARDLARMRPYMSDGLFQTQTYWVEAYRAAGLRNVSEGARIKDVQLARVTSDRFFDAITVRVFASGLDYTVTDRDGRVVSGHRSKPREYTEYWTLIRGASRSGPSRAEAVCPSCGAALEINMAGTCKFCRAKITSGEFDWVLSRIEQDEVYEG